MTIKHPNRLWLTALLLAWLTDQLLWGKALGINFPILTALVTAGGLLAAYWQGHRLPRRSLALVVPILLFAVVTAFRMEPMTIFVSAALALGLMALLAETLLSGAWTRFSLTDGIANTFNLMGSAVWRSFPFFAALRDHTKEAQVAGTSPRPGERIAPVARGVLLAIPVVAIMGGLLSSADPIFSAELQHLFSWIDLNRLGEYITRGIFIAIFTIVLLGVYLHSLQKSADIRLIGQERAWLVPFLGWTEAVIILGSVAVLFAFFVGVQFRYFFGGIENINAAGYTFADYARRGFGELVFVAVLTLLLLLGLSAATSRTTSTQRRVFSGLSVLLVALVAIMLVSAFQRLTLYETAYGFTRTRIYTHVFMIWLGVLLGAVAVLELSGKLRAFGLAALAASLGFGLTLAVINVDRLIVQENVSHATGGAELDFNYLTSLSDDAVPALLKAYRDPAVQSPVKEQVGGAFACLAQSTQQAPVRHWAAYNFSVAQAQRLFAENQDIVQAFPISTDSAMNDVPFSQGGAYCYASHGD